MGLTDTRFKIPTTPCQQCGNGRNFTLKKLGITTDKYDYVVALAGNPNTGKSTVFNALTGLKQHTGNWPGKTVTRAEGAYSLQDKNYKLIDLPGTYSLISGSADEEIARNFILFGNPDVTVVVIEATRLERNLNLLLQIIEITDKVVVCLNLIDEARRKGIHVDDRQLSRLLNIPVVPTSARYGEGLKELLRTIEEVASGRMVVRPLRTGYANNELKNAIHKLGRLIKAEFPAIHHTDWVAERVLDLDRDIIDSLESGELTYHIATNKPYGIHDAEKLSLETEEKPFIREVETIKKYASELREDLGLNFHDRLIENFYARAAEIANHCISCSVRNGNTLKEKKLDRLLTSKIFGFPIMFLVLSVVLWITLEGANYPSQFLSYLFLDQLHPFLKNLADSFLPWWLAGVTIDGMYLATAWVISVMLPPMAIFFPLFTLLEDFGYLPRVAFNLDRIFKAAGTQGKQSLTMCMGFGCNAAGIISTRIIDSPRERLIAIITNNFALCNGRWPTQILIAFIFLGTLVPPYLAGMVSSATVIFIALLGIFFTFMVSWFLSKTILKGEPSAFSLELPPYRPPRIWQTIYTSLIDRTLFVLWRAVLFSLPAGAVIWLIANIMVDGSTLSEVMIRFLDPAGLFIGLNGIILLAYIVAIPANEIVIPTILMLTVLSAGITGIGEGAGVMFELENRSDLLGVLQAGGWTLLTGINLLLFSLLHNPCSTTIYTIYRETRSIKWTAISTFLPLLIGILVTFLVTRIYMFFM